MFGASDVVPLPSVGAAPPPKMFCIIEDTLKDGIGCLLLVGSYQRALHAGNNIRRLHLRI